MAVKLSDTLSADGSTSAIGWSGGHGRVVASGTFGSGTLELDASIDGGSTWVGVGVNGQLTAAGTFEFSGDQATQYRLTLSGATSPSIAVTITG